MNEIAREILRAAEKIPKCTERIIIAIDGRCAAGKSTLAECLCALCGCNVIHMDDFFLRPEQKSEERLNTPGGNIDHERFLCEVLKPLKAALPFSYRPYSCKTGGFTAPIAVDPQRLTVIEGSYSCHPQLWEYSDLHIFLTVSQKEQLIRLAKRNGEVAVKVFAEKWIPLEEAYFNAFDIDKRCEMSFDTTKLYQ